MDNCVRVYRSSCRLPDAAARCHVVYSLSGLAIISCCSSSSSSWMPGYTYRLQISTPLGDAYCSTGLSNYGNAPQTCCGLAGCLRERASMQLARNDTPTWLPGWLICWKTAARQPRVEFARATNENFARELAYYKSKLGPTQVH